MKGWWHLDKVTSSHPWHPCSPLPPQPVTLELLITASVIKHKSWSSLMVENTFVVSKVQNTTCNSSVEPENQTCSWETCFLAFLMRWIKAFSQTHLYGWVMLSEGGLKDYVDRRLLWVVTRSCVLKTCGFFLHCNSRGWGFDFHFVLTSCWGLTWSLLGGWWCDCSTLEQDRHLGLPVQTLLLLQAADFYPF